MYGRSGLVVFLLILFATALYGQRPSVPQNDRNERSAPRFDAWRVIVEPECRGKMTYQVLIQGPIRPPGYCEQRACRGMVKMVNSNNLVDAC